MLGILYHEGQGVSKDLIHSYAWANIAILSGSNEIIKLRDNLSKVMPPNQIAEAKKLSTKITKQIAKNRKKIKNFDLFDIK